ncbi:MAG: triose-phosphate isomerase [Deltaproteobacteria bacterium]|nr:triose-phosphate isomerase [Deltaproteobacteria bacterium]
MTVIPQIIAGNWKMNLTLSQGLEFVDTLLSGLAGKKLSRKLLLAPNFTLLAALAGRCAGSAVGLAAQNCAFQEVGAFTGETSVAMLKDAGAAYVLVGHSERRQIFDESDDLLRQKARAVAEGGLTPIFCVGETLDQRQAGKAFEVVISQLKSGLDGFPGSCLIVAYEPVWAIGTGQTATAEDARLMHARIRKFLEVQFPWGARVPILYGGSAKPENAAELLAQPEVDGLLVGGASLDPESFLQIAMA